MALEATKNMITRYSLLLACLTTAAISAQQNGPTLRELARRGAPAPLLRTVQRELVPYPLEQIIPKADLVIHGRVKAAQSYLSSDERSVYTDYVMTPIRLLYEPPSASGQPREPKTVTVKRWGGQIALEGVSVTLEDLDLAQFQVGDELFLVLALDKSDGKYQLIGQVSGGFRVRNDRIEPLVNSPGYEQLRGTTLDELQTLTNRLRR
jgi:hypothetical protein